MSLLPHYEFAIIENEKLNSYCLNPEHPEGANKAIVFKSALGITMNNSYLLKQAILEGIRHNPAVEREETKFGKKFSVLMKIRIFDREANVMTAWIIEHNIPYPRLVSCYIKT